MTEKLEIYKCNICGNIVEIINSGKGNLLCCNESMEHLTEKNSDEVVQEKHVPVITTEGESKIIRVGSIPHPMAEEHYIMFIEAISKDKKRITRQYLVPQEKPEMGLNNNNDNDFTARELCNIHGLWISNK